MTTGNVYADTEDLPKDVICHEEFPSYTPEGNAIKFGLSEAKKLLEQWVCVAYLREAHKGKIIQLRLTEDMVKALEETLDLERQKYSILKSQNSRLFEQWENENKLRHEAESASNMSEVVAWVLASAFGVSTLTLLAVVYVK